MTDKGDWADKGAQQALEHWEGDGQDAFDFVAAYIRKHCIPISRVEIARDNWVRARDSNESGPPHLVVCGAVISSLGLLLEAKDD